MPHWPMEKPLPILLKAQETQTQKRKIIKVKHFKTRLRACGAVTKLMRSHLVSLARAFLNCV